MLFEDVLWEHGGLTLDTADSQDTLTGITCRETSLGRVRMFWKALVPASKMCAATSDRGHNGRRGGDRTRVDNRRRGDVVVEFSGVWPGVGKICEPGPGGASSVRGVGTKTINIAVFNDAANTIVPGLEAEFPQQATAFADWCNAAGGINGRKIVIDNRDAALFNAAQQVTAACQSDFMAVGGGMALDQPAVPIREKCGLGQISGYVVSNASDLASDQVDPSGINTDSVTSGWFGALAKAYPKAVKKAGMGAGDTPSVLQPETKDEFGAEAQGWKVVDFLEPPVFGGELGTLRRGLPEQRGSRPCGRPTMPTSPPSPRR